MKSIINIIRHKLNSRGSYVIEACIILPIVLIGILSVGSLSRSYYCDFKVKTQLDDELRLATGRAYLGVDDKILPIRVKSRLDELYHGKKSEVENVKITSYRYNFSTLDYDSLVAIKVDYEKNLHILTVGNYDNKSSSKSLGRLFIGDKKDRDKFTFDKMEKYDNDNLVYIFPTDGKRYHRENCSYVKPRARKLSIGQINLSKYSPCPICKNKKGSFLGDVYIFEGYGDYYHKGSCNTVMKNVIKITAEKAKKRGYTPCSKCNP